MVVDLTHVIHPKMPVYPGTTPPFFESGTSLEEDGFLEKKISFFSHTGTHMDAPAHIIPHAKTLDALHVSHFQGAAVCIDVRGEKITKVDILPFKEQLDGADFVIFRSRWSRYWGEARYFEDFPTLNEEAAHFLCTCGLKGIGLDMISIDPVEEESLPIHHIILGHGMVIIENLTNLEALPRCFTFFALPLHVQDADGAPVRAIASF